MPAPIKWVVHDKPHFPDSESENNAENDAPFSVSEPPTLRVIPAARVIEFDPDARPSQQYRIVDVTEATRPTLAKCASLAAAERAATGR